MFFFIYIYIVEFLFIKYIGEIVVNMELYNNIYDFFDKCKDSVEGIFLMGIVATLVGSILIFLFNKLIKPSFSFIVKKIPVLKKIFDKLIQKKINEKLNIYTKRITLEQKIIFFFQITIFNLFNLGLIIMLLSFSVYCIMKNKGFYSIFFLSFIPICSIPIFVNRELLRTINLLYRDGTLLPLLEEKSFSDSNIKNNLLFHFMKKRKPNYD